MEGFLLPPYNYNVYPGYGPYTHYNQKPKHQNWNKKGETYIAPEAVDYLDICKRAQLKAILSQVNPNLTPRLRKANTKEIGVQVNPKVDAIVQCSLGPKTLFYRQRKWVPPRSPAMSPSLMKSKFMPSTPVNNVRFSRPIAIYSPVFDRRFFTLADKENKENDFSSDSDADERDEGAKTLPPTKPKHDEGQQVDKVYSTSQEQRKFRFQFLEQKYGFFHCSQCNIRWESAYVWCISGTNKVYFKQLCRKCQKGYNPYKVESILCQTCSKNRCSCVLKKRHIDIKRPHRQDLCGRCKGKRLSCDTTYSFKYIV
uniref:Zygote arrest 1-like n=1 Tax=Lepisosteus oculatus TaxID=7918 RepID=W5MNI4_LEPOC